MTPRAGRGSVTAASNPLHKLLIDAAREFNAGRYFEAHEVLEEGLDDVPDDLWELVTGLIQIAVGYHKTTQQLWSGAIRMLESGLAKTARFADDAADVNLEALRAHVRCDVARIRAGELDAETLARDPPRLQPTSRRR